MQGEGTRFLHYPRLFNFEDLPPSRPPKKAWKRHSPVVPVIAIAILFCFLRGRPRSFFIFERMLIQAQLPLTSSSLFKKAVAAVGRKGWVKKDGKKKPCWPFCIRSTGNKLRRKRRRSFQSHPSWAAAEKLSRDGGYNTEPLVAVKCL